MLCPFAPLAQRNAGGNGTICIREGAPMNPNEILRKYYGYPSFRPGQGEVVSAILEGRDALAIMPIMAVRIQIGAAIT